MYPSNDNSNYTNSNNLCVRVELIWTWSAALSLCRGRTNMLQYTIIYYDIL